MISNIDGFFKWNIESNAGSLKFLETTENMDTYFDIIREHYKSGVFSKNIEKMERWFSKNGTYKALENETLRMTVIEG
jgi:hypothetical protein